MSNIAITNVDNASLELANVVYEDDTIASAGADVLAVGTILARVTATGKLGLYATGGAGGLGVPVAVLPTKVTFTGAGDKNVKVIVGGEVRFSKLIIDVDGSNANITPAVRDALRLYGITSIKSTQLSIQDNQ